MAEWAESSHSSYHREVRGSIPGEMGFFLARVLPFLASTIGQQAGGDLTKTLRSASLLYYSRA